MERKYLMAIIILIVVFAVGCGVLVYKNYGVSAASAQISRVFGVDQNWVEIKPRIVEEKQAAKAALVEEEKPASLKSGKTTQAKTSVPAAKSKKTSVVKKAKAIKEEKPAIKWCSVKANDIAAKKVIINEVAWMGSPASFSDEWIELKNISTVSLNLAGWQLQNKNQKIAVQFGEGDMISAGNHYLLERTNDDSVPGVTADKIYSGSLGNTNEGIYLFDNNCQLQDSVVGVAKWPAGDNTTKKTMVRLPNLLWQTSKAVGGTPKAENQ